jgi:hypothetical protein
MTLLLKSRTGPQFYCAATQPGRKLIGVRTPLISTRLAMNLIGDRLSGDVKKPSDAILLIAGCGRQI